MGGLSSLPCGIPAFVTGDFNINILKKASITNKCLQLMNYYGFQQIIKLPPHRRGGLLDNNRAIRILLFSAGARIIYTYSMSTFGKRLSAIR
jgi:hypothetical protein